MGEKETVYVVIDQGDVTSSSVAIVRGVYVDKEDAERHKEKIENPFKSVKIGRSKLYK